MVTNLAGGRAQHTVPREHRAAGPKQNGLCQDGGRRRRKEKLLQVQHVRLNELNEPGAEKIARASWAIRAKMLIVGSGLTFEEAEMPPARVYLLLTVVLGSMLMYGMRVNISIALNSE